MFCDLFFLYYLCTWFSKWKTFEVDFEKKFSKMGNNFYVDVRKVANILDSIYLYTKWKSRTLQLQSVMGQKTHFRLTKS